MSKTTLQDLTTEVELYNMIGHDPAYDYEDDSDEEEMVEANDAEEDVNDFEPDEPGLMCDVIIPRIENLSLDKEESADAPSEADDEEQEAQTEAEDENPEDEKEDDEEDVGNEGKCKYMFIICS